jgi:hypothetical protein
VPKILTVFLFFLNYSIIIVIIIFPRKKKKIKKIKIKKKKKRMHIVRRMSQSKKFGACRLEQETEQVWPSCGGAAKSFASCSHRLLFCNRLF